MWTVCFIHILLFEKNFKNRPLDERTFFLGNSNINGDKDLYLHKFFIKFQVISTHGWVLINLFLICNIASVVSFNHLKLIFINFQFRCTTLSEDRTMSLLTADLLRTSYALLFSINQSVIYLKGVTVI